MGQRTATAREALVDYQIEIGLLDHQHGNVYIVTSPRFLLLYTTGGWGYFVQYMGNIGEYESERLGISQRSADCMRIGVRTTTGCNSKCINYFTRGIGQRAHLRSYVRVQPNALRKFRFPLLV